MEQDILLRLIKIDQDTFSQYTQKKVLSAPLKFNLIFIYKFNSINSILTINVILT